VKPNSRDIPKAASLGKQPHFLSEFAIRSNNITSVKNLILRRDYVPKVVNYMTEVIEQMGIPEHIDD
jgi:hypothetical protein